MYKQIFKRLEKYRSIIYYVFPLISIKDFVRLIQDFIMHSDRVLIKRQVLTCLISFAWNEYVQKLYVYSLFFEQSGDSRLQDLLHVLHAIWKNF